MRPAVASGRGPVRGLAVLLAVMLLAAGCGAGGDEDPFADLQKRVNTVQAAVEAGDPETARSALKGLREAVLEHRASGRLDRDRTRAIISAAHQVEEHLGELETPPEEEPSASPGEREDARGPQAGWPA